MSNLGHVTAEQAASYREHGYLYPIRAMTEAQAADFRARVEALEAEWLDNGLPLPLNTYKRVNA
jgi:hypothetical protein